MLTILPIFCSFSARIRKLLRKTGHIMFPTRHDLLTESGDTLKDRSIFPTQKRKSRRCKKQNIVR